MIPPVPADADLRDFHFMPLDVVRIRDSGLTIEATGDEFRAAVLLWCASWHQLPAGSLPQNEAALCHLAGYGRDLEGWRAVKSGAMRGWQIADDCRLYHPVVSEKAREAWSAKLAQRSRTAAARAARHSPSNSQPHAYATGSVTEDATGSVTGSKVREVKGSEGKGTEQALSAGRQQQPPLFREDQPAPPAQRPPKTFGDFQAMHPRIHVHRDDRESWVAAFRLWGWEAMDEAYHKTAKTLTDSKHRVLLGMVTKYLDDHFEVPKDQTP